MLETSCIQTDGLGWTLQARAYNNQGMAHLAQADRKSAMACFAKACQIAPGMPPRRVGTVVFHNR
jgi:hypothetical protein